MMAAGFWKGGGGFLKAGGEMVKGGGTVNREIRVGVTHVSCRNSFVYLMVCGYLK